MRHNELNSHSEKKVEGTYHKKSMLLDESAAEYLGLSVQTLRNYRHLRKGPNYIKIGRSVRYLVGDLDDYIAKHRIELEG